MTKYHISEDGNPRACRATTRPCRYGGEAGHYSSKEEAREAYEVTQAALNAMKAEERPPYPIEGDAVRIASNASVWDNGLEIYEGQEGTVVAFNGSSYEVEFPDGARKKLNWQAVKLEK